MQDGRFTSPKNSGRNSSSLLLPCARLVNLFHLRSFGILDETVKKYLRYVRWLKTFLFGSLRWLLFISYEHRRAFRAE